MIHLVKTDTTSIYLSSTKSVTTDDFIIILTNNSDNSTHEINISRQDGTLRYDRFVITDTQIDTLPIGWYDYVVVESNFPDTYEDVHDIVQNTPYALVEIGRLEVRPLNEQAPVTYVTDKPTTTDYEPEAI